MFDITSSKLLLLGIVALIVIGPKDLPVLLRTIGKYVGMIRRQAAEFRSQFEEAIRESELDQLKKEVEGMGAEAEATIRETERSVTSEFDTIKSDVEQATANALEDKPADPLAHTADGVPAVAAADTKDPGESTDTAVNGFGPHDESEAKRAEDVRIAHKSGA